MVQISRTTCDLRVPTMVAQIRANSLSPNRISALSRRWLHRCAGVGLALRHSHRVKTEHPVDWSVWSFKSPSDTDCFWLHISGHLNITFLCHKRMNLLFMKRDGACYLLDGLILVEAQVKMYNGVTSLTAIQSVDACSSCKAVRSRAEVHTVGVSL
jgi:hypothetical protein